MSSRNSVENAERILTFVLRLIGTTSLFALIFVVAPRSWMESIHAGLGMGRLPEAPVVGYLARSTSAFYALLGGLFWVVSLNLRRHSAVLRYLGGAVASLGVALIWIDWTEGMPLFWKVWEGPFVAILGLVIYWASGRVASATDR